MAFHTPRLPRPPSREAWEGLTPAVGGSTPAHTPRTGNSCAAAARETHRRAARHRHRSQAWPPPAGAGGPDGWTRWSPRAHAPLQDGNVASGALCSTAPREALSASRVRATQEALSRRPGAAAVPDRLGERTGAATRQPLVTGLTLLGWATEQPPCPAGPGVPARPQGPAPVTVAAGALSLQSGGQARGGCSRVLGCTSRAHGEPRRGGCGAQAPPRGGARGEHWERTRRPRRRRRPRCPRRPAAQERIRCSR